MEEDVILARMAWHRQRGLGGQSCPTNEMCEAFDAGFQARGNLPKTLEHKTRGLTAAEVESHYPISQHQPDECEMCRAIHDIAKEALDLA